MLHAAVSSSLCLMHQVHEVIHMRAYRVAARKCLPVDSIFALIFLRLTFQKCAPPLNLITEVRRCGALAKSPTHSLIQLHIHPIRIPAYLHPHSQNLCSQAHRNTTTATITTTPLPSTLYSTLYHTLPYPTLLLNPSKLSSPSLASAYPQLILQPPICASAQKPRRTNTPASNNSAQTK